MTYKKISEWKKEALKKIAEVLRSHSVVAAADLHKVRAIQIQEVRKKLRGKVAVLVTKNTLVRKAAEVLANEKKDFAKFADLLTGPRVLLLTDMNPYSLIILLNKSKVRVPAKAGDVATDDIVVPAGNTGLPPGPVISEFGEARVPTKIESGSIWIVRDTVVVDKGEVVPGKVASLLSKLGMKPMEAGISLVAAYDNGLIFGPEDLILDLNEFKQSLAQAQAQAVSLAINANYFASETAAILIGKAHRQALQLALESEYPCPEALPEILGKAHREMLALSALIPAGEVAPAKKPVEEAKPKAEPKPEAKIEAKPAPKAEAKPEVKPETKTKEPVKQPKPQAAAKPEAKPVKKKEVKAGKKETPKKGRK